MANLANELSSIDFGSMIGGSLNAVVSAQSEAAKTTVNFIRSVGFEPGKNEGEIGKPITIAFEYPKQTAPAAEGKPAQYAQMKIEVPLLTMVPIPFIRVDDAYIEFNAKISSVANTQSEEKESKSGSLDVSASGGCSFFKASAKLNASFSNQKSSSSSEEVKRDFSLNIKVHAVQDDMPAGVEKMLNILEESITNTETGNTNTGGQGSNATGESGTGADAA